MSYRFRVILVLIDGQQRFVISNSCFGEAPVADPLQARHFPLTEEGDADLRKALNGLVMPSDYGFAKSGLRIDDIPPLVVTYEAQPPVEVASHIGRQAYARFN